MYIIMAGELSGIALVPGEQSFRERVIEGGDSVNVLTVLRVHSLCVETVVCSKGTHTEVMRKTLGADHKKGGPRNWPLSRL